MLSKFSSTLLEYTTKWPSLHPSTLVHIRGVCGLHLSESPGQLAIRLPPQIHYPSNSRAPPPRPLQFQEMQKQGPASVAEGLCLGLRECRRCRKKRSVLFPPRSWSFAQFPSVLTKVWGPRGAETHFGSPRQPSLGPLRRTETRL